MRNEGSEGLTFSYCIIINPESETLTPNRVSNPKLYQSEGFTTTLKIAFAF
jgi:hypothetical protein